MKTEFKVGGKVIELVEGDITQYKAAVLVVPANIDFSYDEGFPGIMGALVRAAGSEVFEDASREGTIDAKRDGYVKFPGMNYRGLKHPFDGIVTEGGNLGDVHLIHLVSKEYAGNRPVPNSNIIVGTDGSYIDDVAIRKSVSSALGIASQRGFDSVGFPALGTGLYRVPLEESVINMVGSMRDHLATPTPVNRIGLILYGQGAYNLAKSVASASLQTH